MLISHAYTECRHVAQCFALPKFGDTQHDVKSVILDASVRNGDNLHRNTSGWEDAIKRAFDKETSGMQEVLPDGGVIRKLWIGEHNKYRDPRFGEPAQPLG